MEYIRRWKEPGGLNKSKEEIYQDSLCLEYMHNTTTEGGGEYTLNKCFQLMKYISPLWYIEEVMYYSFDYRMLFIGTTSLSWAIILSAANVSFFNGHSYLIYSAELSTTIIPRTFYVIAYKVFE